MELKRDIVPFPGKMIRGRGALSSIGEVCQSFGKKAFIMGGKTALEKTQSEVVAQLEKQGVEIVAIEWYGGECTHKIAQDLADKVQSKNGDVIIAIGGGKVMDTGKLTAYRCNLPLITVPTIAATCAAIAAVSVVYNEKGEFIEPFQLGRSPEATIIDTEVILRAPLRWLAAGLGDTLAKWYEYRVSIIKAPKNGLSFGALANGKLCYDLIEAFGGLAIEAVKTGEYHEALDSAVDAIILYAGMASLLGGTDVEAAAAHAFYNGMTRIPASHAAGHGLIVGYGNLFLLALEKRSDEELIEAIQLAKRCGVPTALKEIVALNEEELAIVAEAAIACSDMNNMPFAVTPEKVYRAIERVDQLAESL